MRLKFLGALCAGLALAACASTSTTTGPGSPAAGPTDPAQSVYALEGTLTTAINIATIYAQLPSCSVGGPTLCSDPAIVMRIQASAAAATAAVQAAQAAVTGGASSPAAQQAAVAAAAQAVAALNALTTTVKTQ